MSDALLARIIARRHLSSQDLCAIVVFGFGHPDQSIAALIAQFVRGEGPAAIARGVGGVRRTPPPLPPTP